MAQRFWVGAAFLLALTAGVYGEGKIPTAAPHAGLDRMKKMAGTWVEADKDGKPTNKVMSVIKLTGAGSAIHETLMPGDAMEMGSVYQMDKSDLVMTHYCAAGNQPRMKAEAGAKPNQIKWTFTGGSNLDVTKDMHMHAATLIFVDDDHREVAGEAWVDGKACEGHCGQMKLVRKK